MVVSLLLVSDLLLQHGPRENEIGFETGQILTLHQTPLSNLKYYANLADVLAYARTVFNRIGHSLMHMCGM